MGSLGAPEIVIIAVVAILLFGAAKLPVFAKSLGESMRIFKKELKSSGDAEEPKQAAALPPVVAQGGTPVPAAADPAQPQPAAQAPQAVPAADPADQH